jgi:hypothetical protein
MKNLKIAVGPFLKFQTTAPEGSKFSGPLRCLLGHTSLLFSFFSNLSCSSVTRRIFDDGIARLYLVENVGNRGWNPMVTNKDFDELLSNGIGINIFTWFDNDDFA